MIDTRMLTAFCKMPMFAFAWFTFSCSSKTDDVKYTKKQDSQASSSNRIYAKAKEDSNSVTSYKKASKCVSVVENNKLANNIVDIAYMNKVGIESFLNHRYTIIAKIAPNGSDASYIDTTYQIKCGMSSIHFVDLSRHNYVFDNAEVIDNSIKLNYNMRIGMPKSSFSQIIAREELCDSVIVTTDERTLYNIFVFKNGILTRIRILITAL